MRRTLTVALILLTVGGCDDGKGEDAAGRAASSPVSSPSADTDSGSTTGAPFEIGSRHATKDAASAREGRELRGGFVVGGAQAGGRTLNHLGLTPDGQLISAANPVPKTGDGELGIGQSRVGLYSGGRTRTLSPAPSGPPRQAIYADADDRTVAWMETSSTDMYQMDWLVYGFDRSSGRSVLLGDSAPIAKGKKMPIPPGSSMLSVGTDRVYWTTTVPTTGERDFGAQILASSPAGGAAPSVVAQRAKLPAAAGKDLYYVRSEDVAPGFPKSRYEIHKVSGGRDSVYASGPLTGEQQVSALTAEPGHVSWIVTGATEETPGTLFVLPSATKRAIEVTLGDNGPAMTLGSSPKLVCWSNGSGSGDAGQYVLEVATDRMWRLGEAPGLSLAFAGGDFVAWSKLGSEPQKPEQNSLRVARFVGGKA